MKIVDRILLDPRVEDVWFEGEDGWWASLRSGFCWPDGQTHALHEPDLVSLQRELKTVKECFCEDCCPKQ